MNWTKTPSELGMNCDYAVFKVGYFLRENQFGLSFLNFVELERYQA